LAGLGIAFSIVAAALARHVAIKYNLDHFETTVLLLLANVGSFAVFWVAKLLIFNRLFRTELEEFDEHLTREEEEEEEASHTTPR
jgi:hypothetical protein